MSTAARLASLASMAALIAHGAVYYVSPEGDDARSGADVSNAWRTVQHAVATVAPGDVIVLQPGTYAGARIERSGQPRAPIRLRGEPGAKLDQPGPACRHQSILELETWEEPKIVAHWEIEGLEIANAPRYGIDLRHARHIVLRRNRVHHSKLTGIFTAFSDDILVEENQSHHNGEHGIYFSNSGDRPVARGNRLNANRACGIHMNGDLSAGGDGIISDGVIEKNIINGNGTAGGAGINMDGVVRTVVRNNLLYANHATGIALFKGNGAVASSHNRILNNTIVMYPDAGWALSLLGDDCVSNQVFNNVLWSPHPQRGSICVSRPRPEGFASDYNVVTRWFSPDGGGRRIDHHAWRALGYDTHSVITTLDRLFVDTYSDNFRLKAGSPAIDAGCPLEDVRDDLDSRPRPRRGRRLLGAAWDIGAYEY